MPFGLKLAGYAAALGALARAAEAAAQAKRWCCNSAAPPARSRRSASAASRSPSGSPRSSTCRCRTRPGTAIATGWREVASALRHPRRHLRQDRARRFAADADRSRRSLRAGGARPRRLLHHAAQAQSGRRRGGARLRATIAPQLCRHHPRRRRCRSMSARPAPGQAEWPTFPALALVTSGALARDRRHRRGPRSRCRAHARQSRHHARTDHGRGGVVRARRQARQGRGAQASSRKRAARPSPTSAHLQGRAAPRTSGDGAA